MTDQTSILKVLYLGGHDGFVAAQQILGDIVVHVDSNEGSLLRELPKAVAILDASMKVNISPKMIALAPNLRIISCATTGSDHIDHAAVIERGIDLRTLKEDRELLRNITPAAELSFALLLACARRLKGAAAHVEQGGWTREEYPGVMLNGKTLGLVGFGRIGGWMARYAAAFGMHVAVHDPYQSAFPDSVRAVDLRTLVGISDFLSVHVHLSDETKGLLSRDLLQFCKPGIFIINTSRGAILDEAALLDGLKSGQIGGAGLDVLEGEPQTANHPLVEYAKHHPNLIITPHCGGNSPDAVRVVCAHAAKKIQQKLVAS